MNANVCMYIYILYTYMRCVFVSVSVGLFVRQCVSACLCVLGLTKINILYINMYIYI